MCLLLNRHIIAGARSVDVVPRSGSTELTCIRAQRRVTMAG
jgi:hypothetical protein